MVARKLKMNKAFTLVELIVVVAIVGIISAIAVTSYKNARDKQVKQLLSSLVSRIETERAKLGIFTADEVLKDLESGATSVFMPDKTFKLVYNPSSNTFQYFTKVVTTDKGESYTEGSDYIEVTTYNGSDSLNTLLTRTFQQVTMSSLISTLVTATITEKLTEVNLAVTFATFEGMSSLQKVELVYTRSGMQGTWTIKGID